MSTIEKKRSRSLRVILGDQLSHSISSLERCDKNHDVVFLCEHWGEFKNVAHHKKKIAFLLSARRHFANELESCGYFVVYKKLEDKNNSGDFEREIDKVLSENSFDKIIISHPNDFSMHQFFLNLSARLSIPIEICEDKRFYCTPKEFSDWAADRKHMRMEFFYQYMRKRHAVLMDGNEPEGGNWNYDSQNRKTAKSKLKIPIPYNNKPDAITKEVMNLVSEYFSDNFGDIEPFYFSVTAKQARQALHKFIEQRLANFGDYQDAMLENEPWMYHSHVSFYLNSGLLLPIECVNSAENAYKLGSAPLNAVEGFIRQIIGWREYVRGIYWLKMPKYRQVNYFNAKNKLPNFYWTGNTKMNCLQQSILQTKKYAYAHHIQRLMVLGNFLLLLGTDPDEVNEWYLIVYADAFEWVELPNVSGMILYADGGYLASKPYAASGSYINKMSNYCHNCHFNVNKKTGDDACPFNYLYWNFLDKNRSKLEMNHRMRMIYHLYDKFDETKRCEIQTSSKNFIKCLFE